MELPWWWPFGKVPEIPAPRLARDLAAPAPPQVLDVRTEAEFRRGHVRGAVNVPLHALRRRISAAGLDPSRPVVAICLTAHRSVPAVRLLVRSGFRAVQLAGGMMAWRAAGFPEESGAGG